MAERISVAEMRANKVPTPLPPSHGKDDRLVPLPRGGMRPAEAVYQSWHAVIPRQYSFQDACSPDVWRNIHLHMVGNKPPNVGDFVRLVSASGAFDAVCTVCTVECGGRGFTLRFHHGWVAEQDAP
jgi:hypothetical protein